MAAAKAKTAAELFGDRAAPKWVSYARCSVKPASLSAAPVADPTVGPRTDICASYTHQHELNRGWIQRQQEGAAAAAAVTLEDLVAHCSFSEFGSAYQPNVVPPTLLGLLRNLRDATITVAFPDRFCRNIDNLRKIIAPLMRKNRIRLAISSSDHTFDLTTPGYETTLLRMTSLFVTYHEESAVRSERAKEQHQFNLSTGVYEKRRAAKAAAKAALESQAHPARVAEFVRAATAGTLLGADLTAMLVAIASIECKKCAAHIPFRDNRPQPAERIASILAVCGVAPGACGSEEWTAAAVARLGATAATTR